MLKESELASARTWSLNVFKCSQKKFIGFWKCKKVRALRNVPWAYVIMTYMRFWPSANSIFPQQNSFIFFERIGYKPSSATISVNYQQHLFYGPSKLTTLQVCHYHLREAPHNTINCWYVQVPVNFLYVPNIAYGPSPC